MNWTELQNCELPIIGSAQLCSVATTWTGGPLEGICLGSLCEMFRGGSLVVGASTPFPSIYFCIQIIITMILVKSCWWYFFRQTFINSRFIHIIVVNVHRGFGFNLGVYICSKWCSRHVKLLFYWTVWHVHVSVRGTVDCPVFDCAMEEACQYGFVRNANGCQTCECYDPCQVTD